MTQQDFIEENINNLGELDRNDYKYLYINIEQFYTIDTFSEYEQSYIQRLFQKLSEEDFPSKYDRKQIYLTRIDGKLQFINQLNQRCYEENEIFYITPILDKIHGEKFIEILSHIQKNLKDDDMWRQKYYEDKSYNYIDNYVCSDECAISIYKNEILNIFNISKDIKLEDLVNSIKWILNLFYVNY